MKTTKFQVKALGIDNGSGEFERGGDLNRVMELHDQTRSLDFQLLAAIKTALFEDYQGGENAPRVYDEAVSKVGNHYIVSFSVNEEGVGEQNFAFVATEAS